MADSGPALILVADDDPVIVRLLQVNFKLEGYDVETAAHGEEALRKARDLRPALILLDVMMPGVDGWDVARRLAADPATREIRIVFLTARAEASDKRLAQHLGGVGYIVKPFDPVDLGELVEDVLGRIDRGEKIDLQREITEGLEEKP